MFTKEQLAKWEADGFTFPPEYQNWAVDKPATEKKMSALEKDEEKYAPEYNDDPITVNGVVYNFQEIRKRVIEIKKKVQPYFNKLSDEGKLILDLPLIEWKLNYKHGAVMIIHWLEASGKSVKLSYDFFMSENRLENIDVLNLKSYFKNLRYLSAENLGYVPSNPDADWFFLFNDSIPAIKKSLQAFNETVSKASGNIAVGDYNNIATSLSQKVAVKNNLFQSFSIGSAVGDFDDVGTALGRYSYRVYFKGQLNRENNEANWILDITEVAGRFVDEFTFRDEEMEFLSPSTWRSQSLGCWLKAKNPEEPSRLKWTANENKVCLQNSDFVELRNISARYGVKIGGDFLIYSDLRKHDDNFLRKSIMIY